MSVRSWVVIMMIAGGFFEGLGLTMVALDLGRLRRARTALNTRTGRARMGADAELSAAGQIRSSVGRQPTTEERLDALEKRVRNLDQDLRAEVKVAESRIRSDLDARIREAAEDSATARQRIEGVLAELIGTGWQKWGLASFVV